MSWNDIFVAGVAGAGTGVLASILAPWANWGVEKSRLRQKNRQRLTRAWYQMLDICEKNKSDFSEHPAYKTLRPYLTPAVIKDIERSNHIVAIMGAKGIAANHELKTLLDEIHRIEREWRLV